MSEHKRSPLHPVVEADVLALEPVIQKRVTWLGRLANWILMGPARPQPPEQLVLPPADVDPEVYSLALQLSRSIDLSRVRFTRVHAEDCVTMPSSRQLVEDEEVHDAPEDRWHTEQRRQPSASISLSGTNYGKYGTNEDIFRVTFGIYPREDGVRIVECIPREWSDLAYFYEFYGARQAMQELLPAEAALNPRMHEQQQRIRLGTLSPVGEFTPERPVNVDAFGADLVSVWDQISRADTPNVSFSIADDMIDQW